MELYYEYRVPEAQKGSPRRLDKQGVEERRKRPHLQVSHECVLSSLNNN